MRFESEAEGADCTTWELDQDEHSFFPGCCEAYVDSDANSDIRLRLADLNEERSKVTGMTLWALLVPHKDSVALEVMTAENMKDHRVL